MIRKTIILVSFALCVLGDGHHAVSEQHIKILHKEHHGHHGELTHIGSKKPEHHEEYAWSYPSYEFSYSVHDPHTHDEKGQEESRKGDEVKGEYWLIQPDGRKRTVTYHADKHSGFHAIVHYSGHGHDEVEHHGHKDEEHKDDKDEDDKKEHHKEEEKHEEEKKEENEDSDEEDDSEERGGEESRGREGGVVRWGYGPKWDRKEDSYRGDDRRDRDDGRRGDRHRDRDEDHKYDFGKVTIYDSLGGYGRRDDKKRDEGHERDEKRDERDSEESLLWEQRRKFDERRGYPSNIAPYYGHASRINPRFYRHEQQRKSVRRN